MDTCRVYWGTHGCYRPRGHRGGHVCDCSPWIVRRVLHRLLPWHRWRGHVGARPYYGRNTSFYGEDADGG
jgi:hypothetical protein